MSRTNIADPALIPDIEAFEERVAIHIHEGDIPTDEAKDLAAQAQGVCPHETVGVGPRSKTKPASQSGGLGMLFYFFAKRGLGKVQYGRHSQHPYLHED